MLAGNLPQVAPLKHARYDRDLRSPDRVTIAAGVLCQEGILLCADTQHSSSYKSYEEKIKHVDCPQGKVLFALAGNTAFAKSAIRACKRALKKPENAAEQIFDIIEPALRHEYKTVVLDVKAYADKDEYQYGFIIVVWNKGQTGLDLYHSQGLVLAEVARNRVAIGLGGELAEHLMDSWHGGAAVPLGAVLASCAFMLAQVKMSVPECGGYSQYSMIGWDGREAPIEIWNLVNIEEGLLALNTLIYYAIEAATSELSDVDVAKRRDGIGKLFDHLRSITAPIRLDALKKGVRLRPPNPKPTTAESSGQQPSQE